MVIGRLVSGEWRKLNIGTVVIAVALVTFYAGGLGYLIFHMILKTGGNGCPFFSAFV